MLTSRTIELFLRSFSMTAKKCRTWTFSISWTDFYQSYCRFTISKWWTRSQSMTLTRTAILCWPRSSSTRLSSRML